MSDLEQMSELELSVYIARAQEALGRSPAAGERVRLTEWMLELRMEQDWRTQMQRAGAAGVPQRHVEHVELIAA